MRIKAHLIPKEDFTLLDRNTEIRKESFEDCISILLLVCAFIFSLIQTQIVVSVITIWAQGRDQDQLLLLMSIYAVVGCIRNVLSIIDARITNDIKFVSFFMEDWKGLMHLGGYSFTWTYRSYNSISNSLPHLILNFIFNPFLGVKNLLGLCYLKQWINKSKLSYLRTETRDFSPMKFKAEKTRIDSQYANLLMQLKNQYNLNEVAIKNILDLAIPEGERIISCLKDKNNQLQVAIDQTKDSYSKVLVELKDKDQKWEQLSNAALIADSIKNIQNSDILLRSIETNLKELETATKQLELRTSERCLKARQELSDEIVPFQFLDVK